MPFLEVFLELGLSKKQPITTLIVSEFGPNMSEIFGNLLILKGRKHTFDWLINALHGG